MKFIDLSHTIEDGTVTYKGLPAPKICDYWTREESKNWYDEDTSFQIGKIEMVSNTGTYIDTPFHRYEDGKDLSDILIEKTALLNAVVIRVPYQESKVIDAAIFKQYDINNKAVLVHTGWDELWQKEEYYTENPYLTAEAAQYLVDQKVILVGIDSYNIDDVSGKTRPVHTILLKNEILIVEHLCNLHQIPDGVAIKFCATPPKVKGMGTFPVRAYIVVE